MKRAVLFDMNGILVNDEHLQERAFRELLEPLGYTFTAEEYIHFFIGKVDVLSLGDFFSDRGVEGVDCLELAKRRRLLYDTIAAAENVQSYDGVEGVLGWLKERKIPTAVVTSESSAVAQKTLTRLGFLDYFDAIITSDDVQKGKPSPEGYLRGVEALGLAAPDCVVIEDAPSGIDAARAAGSFVVAVTNTHPSEALMRADMVVESLSDEQMYQFFGGGDVL